MRSTCALSRAVTGQVDVFSAPAQAYANPGSVPGVIYCHGAGQLGADPTNSVLGGQYPLYNALREKFCLTSGDFGGNSWGNPSAVGNVDSMKTWMQSTMGVKSGKVALVGISMGTLTALNYAKANPSKVACVVSVLPAVNLNDFYSNNRGGFAASVTSAYGGSYNDSTQGPTSNPYNYAASFPGTIPVQLYYSTADTIALPSYVTSFASAAASASAIQVSTTLDHSEAAIAQASINSITAFIAAHLP